MTVAVSLNPKACLQDLRRRIEKLEHRAARKVGPLPFGIRAVDSRLPGEGLASGTLHEISGGGMDEVHAAAATLFTSGVAARSPGPVLWCATSQDLFAPGLACAGLHPDRVLYASATDERVVLLVMEEALRDGSFAVVVGELAKLPMTASRRLKLAAEASGTIAVALRRRREGRVADDGLTASATRWRISPLPSAPLATAGIGRARWLVELTRCRGGDPSAWIMEGCDAQGCLALVAELADRSAAQGFGEQAARKSPGRHAA